MKRRLYVITTCIGAVALLTACGGATSNSSQTVAKQSAGGASSHILTYAYARSFSVLDPAVAFTAETDLLSQVYETLTRYDTKTQQVVPVLATSWSHNSDATVWTFHLRPGVKFQDGTPFNSAAVKFTIDRELHINQGPAYIWSAVKKIDTPNALTVVLRLSQPQPMDLLAASGWGAFMMSPTSDNHPTSWFNAGRGVGTGPYEYVSYQPGQSLVLKKFPGYWGGWHANQFTRVVMDFVPSATTREQMVRSGQATMALNVSRSDLASLASTPSLKVWPMDAFDVSILRLNTKRAPTNNLLVRQALLAAFPKNQMIADAYFHYATPSPDFGPPSLWGTNLPPTGVTFDLAKAKALLARAGYSNGTSITFISSTDAYPEEQRIGELWKAELAQIGVTLNIRNVSFNTEQAIYSLPNPEAAPQAGIFEWTPTYPSLADYLANAFGSAAPLHLSFFNNKTYDNLVNTGVIQSATDRSAAAVTFQRAAQMAINNALGMPIADAPDIWVAQSNVTGFTNTPFALLLYSLHLKD